MGNKHDLKNVNRRRNRNLKNRSKSKRHASRFDGRTKNPIVFLTLFDGDHKITDNVIAKIQFKEEKSFREIHKILTERLGDLI